MSKEEITAESYQTKMGKKLFSLYEQHDKKLCESKGTLGMLYKMIHGEIPHFITGIDSDPELQVKIKTFIMDIAEALREDK